MLSKSSPRKKVSRPMRSDLPTDIIRSILSKSPVKSLLRFQSVCKEWRCLIQDSYFKRSYRGEERLLVVSETVEYSEPHRIIVDSVSHDLLLEKPYEFTEHLCFLKGKPYRGCRVWGYCNGLLLVSVDIHIFLWNPSTRYCVKVLELECLADSSEGIRASGFCYDSHSGDYKAIIIFPPQIVLVSSLKHKEWREVTLPYFLLDDKASLHFRNTLHLVVTDAQWRRGHRYSMVDKIVYFDPHSEKFELLPTGIAEERRGEIIVDLGVIDNCLSVAIYRSHKSIEILSMKEYGVAESWVTMFDIPVSELLANDYGLLAFYSYKHRASTRHWDEWIAVLKMSTKGEIILNGEKCKNVVAMCLYAESFASPYEFIWIDEHHKHLAKMIKYVERKYPIKFRGSG